MNKPRLDIGIPAHNEAANIARLLKSIFEQNQDNYRLHRVMVVSDGSVDHTVQAAQKIKNPKLTVVEHADNAGKPTRTNEIFREADCDIVVLIDADVVLNSPHTLAALVEPIIKDEATLVSGRPQKTKTGSFTDHVMDVSLYLQDQVKRRLRHGQSVYACHGRIVALHRKTFSTLTVPPAALGDDAYLYFYNQQHGDGFAYAADATAVFKMPQSLKDYIKQQHRFSTTPEEEAATFGEAALREYRIPKGLSVRILFTALYKYHVYTVAYACYRLAAKLSWLIKGQTAWTASETTKEL